MYIFKFFCLPEVVNIFELLRNFYILKAFEKWQNTKVVTFLFRRKNITDLRRVHHLFQKRFYILIRMFKHDVKKVIYRRYVTHTHIAKDI